MYLKRFLVILCVNIISFAFMFNVNNKIVLTVLTGFSFIFLAILNIHPLVNKYPSKKIYVIASGSELLKLFLTTLFFTSIIQIYFLVKLFQSNNYFSEQNVIIIASLIYATGSLVVIFWNGIIRVYTTSLQLGLKMRVLGILFGWVLGINLYYLRVIIKRCDDEVEFETQKIEINKVRAKNSICKTKYPILLVHGVFFRDYRYLNYWGRVPQELQRNGATVYYGMQQSAATVDYCGKEIASRIESIVKETGSEKVNIIAHSKGGLDSRVAISKYGASKYVASITTINTPHRGCLFSEYVLNIMPEKMKQVFATSYNTTIKKFGDVNPDFMGAVLDLTVQNCTKINEECPDIDGILYESVASYCNRAGSGRFPLNLSYTIVKHFDGKNDGLVGVESAKWGTSNILLKPIGNRGISHGDLIDLNRENIADFDVREFYVDLVSKLKTRGY